MTIESEGVEMVSKAGFFRLEWSKLKESKVGGEASLEGSRLVGSRLVWTRVVVSKLKGTSLDMSKVEGSKLLKIRAGLEAKLVKSE